MMAELLFTICTGETSVCVLSEALGVEAEEDLPYDHKKEAHTEKRERVRVGDKGKGSKHHRVIPVVYSTASTTLVLHKPGLEGAEIEYADHIAHGIEEGYKDED